MYKLTGILLICALWLPVKAQYPGYSVVTDLPAFREQFTAASKMITSIKSDFVQVKTLSMLSEKIVSSGKFWFKKSNLVRMEYQQPFQYLMILNGDKVFIKDGEKKNTLSVSANKVFQQINKIIVDCLQGSALSSTDFQTKVFQNATGYLVELQPLSKSLRGFFKTINIVADKKNYSVNTIELNENGGDNTLIRFSNKEINTSFPDALFTIK